MNFNNFNKNWSDKLALEFIETIIKEQQSEENKRFFIYEPLISDLRFIENFIQKQGIDSDKLEKQIFKKVKKELFTEEDQSEETKPPTRVYEFPDYLFKNLRVKSEADLIAEHEAQTKTKLQGEETKEELYEILDDSGVFFRNKCKPYYLLNNYPGKEKFVFTEEDFYNNEKRIDKNEEIDYHVRKLSYNYIKTAALKNPNLIFNKDRAVYGIDKHFYFYRQRPWAKIVEFFEGSPDAWEYIFIYYVSYIGCLYIIRKLYAFCKWFWGFGGEVPFRFFWWPF